MTWEKRRKETSRSRHDANAQVKRQAKSLFGNLPGRLADAAGCPDVSGLLRCVFVLEGAGPHDPGL